MAAPAHVRIVSNGSAGLTSATFPSSNGGAVAAQLSEWSVPMALDQTGSASTPDAATSITVSTSGALAAAGDLAISVFGQATSTPSLVTYTPGAGWTALGSTGNTTTHYTADYRIGVGPGAVSETETSSSSATWSGAFATFK